MNVTIGMIVLNESEYIWANLCQHYEFADKIVIVEGADPLYPKERVTGKGLSMDATAQLVRDFPDPDKKIVFVQHGFASANGDQAKCELRNRYMEHVLEGLLIVVDADEFYMRRDLYEAIQRAVRQDRMYAWQYPQIHFWKTPEQFITGQYYDVTHTRFWRVTGKERYTTDHNSPHELAVKMYNRKLLSSKGGEKIEPPVCYHFGFCKSQENMRDKNTYYVNRGEKRSRPKTTRSRAAWFLPDAAVGDRRLTIRKYSGPLPEVFQSMAEVKICDLET